MNLRYTVTAVMLLASVPAYAAPGEMSVAAFLAKADALRARGAMALFSSDYKLLKGEGMAAGQAYRARLVTERAEGKPSSCPPRPAPVNSDNLLAHMRSYPAADRPRITINTAMADLFIKSWPCR